jgi:hypothetical protein
MVSHFYVAHPYQKLLVLPIGHQVYVEEQAFYKLV